MAVFIDGPVHDAESVAERDAAAEERLYDAGWRSCGSGTTTTGTQSLEKFAVDLEHRLAEWRRAFAFHGEQGRCSSRQKNDVIAWCDVDEGFVFRVRVKGEVAFGKLVVACGEAGLRQGEAEAFARAQRKLNVGVGGVGFDPAVLNGARGGVLDENEEAVPFEFMTAIGERGQIQGVEGIEGVRWLREGGHVGRAGQQGGR